MTNDRNKLLRIALVLSFITIGYNLIEGVISIFFGLEDETLALLGFGVDSFVEVISGIGIAHMIFRMRQKKNNIDMHDQFERQALRITGFAFYLLTAGLVVGGGLKIIQQSEPSTTIVGVIISSISILTMYFLMHYKLKVGRKLNSEAVVADANCTRSCFYLSIVLLVSSGLYELFQIPYIDVAGSLGIAWFAFNEGRESFEKAKTGQVTCCDDDHCAT